MSIGGQTDLGATWKEIPTPKGIRCSVQCTLKELVQEMPFSNPWTLLLVFWTQTGKGR